MWTEENVVDIEAQAATTMRTGRALTDQERAWISADGSVRWFTFTHVPLRDHGTVSGLVCTVQEVTTRKELEQEILEISNREQRRLGSDLHDGLGQELTGLSLLLKGLEVQLSREVAAVHVADHEDHAICWRTRFRARARSRAAWRRSTSNAAVCRKR